LAVIRRSEEAARGSAILAGADLKASDTPMDGFDQSFKLTMGTAAWWERA